MDDSAVVNSSSLLLELHDSDNKNTDLTTNLARPSNEPISRINIVGHVKGRDDNSSVLMNTSYDDTSSMASSSKEKVTFLNRCCCGFFHIFQIPFTDHSGKVWNVTKGLFGISIIGTLLGISAPKSRQFPGLYGTFSSIIGYTYFLCWSISFYPQVFMNYKRKTTRGLSPDFALLNLMGFFCYAIYTCSFYWSSLIHQEYKNINGKNAEVTVRSNDVAFSLHASLLCFVQVCQIFYYDGMQAQPISIQTLIFMVIAILVCTGLVMTVWLSKETSFTWLQFMYVLAGVKLFITTVKYIPQVVANKRRQSTEGWNIWNVVLDLTGGLLSLAQLISDSIYLDDFHGITGNWVKFGLSFVSIFFDIVFLLQHYVLYPQRKKKRKKEKSSDTTVAESLLDNDDYRNVI